MPQEADMELHAGEFLAINELMDPMEEEDNPALEASSGIIVYMIPPDNSASSDASANGHLAPNAQAIPDLNLELQPIGPEPIAQPQAQQHFLAAEIHLPLPNMEEQTQLPVMQAQVISDPSLDAIIQQTSTSIRDRQEDPMQFELLANAHIPVPPTTMITEPAIPTTMITGPAISTQVLHLSNSPVMINRAIMEEVMR